MNIWDVLLIAGIALAVAYAVYRIVKAKKSGKTCSCGCSGCANAAVCHPRGKEKR